MRLILLLTVLVVGCGGETSGPAPDPACAECAISLPGSHPIWDDVGDVYCVDGVFACEAPDDCFDGQVCEAGFCVSAVCG